MFLSLLDLIGVALVGVIAALTVRGVQSQSPGDSVSRVLSSIKIENLDFRFQIAVLGVLASLFLVIRTLIAIVFTRRILAFLSRKAAEISTKLLSSYLSKSLTFINAKTTQEVLFSLTQGVSTITLNIVGGSINICIDFFLLIVLFTGLFFVNPGVALGTIIYFLAVAFLLNRVLQKRANKLGEEQASITIRSEEKIVETVQGFREAFVRGNLRNYLDEIASLRFRVSKVIAETTFLPFIGKYTIEISLVLGAISLSAFQFLLTNAATAIGTLALFLAAGSRIAPAVLRIQQAAIQVKSGLGISKNTLELATELSTSKSIEYAKQATSFRHEGFVPRISLTGVSFTYPNSYDPAIKNIFLELEPFDSVAIVGPSGAGKSTLADLILGLIDPQEGNVRVSGIPIRDAIAQWPGSIAYVPQQPFLRNASIKENITMGLRLGGEEQISRAISLANLDDFIEGLPNGVDTIIGERGTRLSGGQRQRIGIARALYTEPKLIVLDEATSALDSNSEFEISQSIATLMNKVSVVMVAHRLSLIRDFSQIIYISGGEVKGVDKFDALKLRFPEFARQAELMGL
jgi:ABC-type multidrug transport system fused ATPase/permease subunit